MLTLCLTSLLITICESAAAGYGGSNGGGGNYGGGAGYGGGGSHINVANNGAINSVSNTGPIPAAIQSTHTVEIQTVPVAHNPVEPQVIEVDANVLPLTIHFKSASSNIHVVQSHQPGQVAQVQQTASEDEPHHLLHEVTKPIIQEIREVITPYRRVVQEVRPVQEEIQTIVARGEHRQQQQKQFNDFGAFNAGNGIAQANYGGSGGSIYSGSTGSGVGLLGGSVSVLNGETNGRSGGSSSLSSFASSGKKSKSDSSSSSVVSQERTKDYSKSS